MPNERWYHRPDPPSRPGGGPSPAPPAATARMVNQPGATAVAGVVIAVAVCDRLPWLPHPAVGSDDADRGSDPAAAPDHGP
jgi:hypothetical protein